MNKLTFQEVTKKAIEDKTKDYPSFNSYLLLMGEPILTRELDDLISEIELASEDYEVVFYQNFTMGFTLSTTYCIIISMGCGYSRNTGDHLKESAKKILKQDILVSYLGLSWDDEDTIINRL